MNKQLAQQIRMELDEDLNRYDKDFEVWSEVVLDCPSDTLDELLGQIPEGEMEEMYEDIIYPTIRSLNPDK